MLFESKSGVFLIAGVGFFALSFLVMGLLPWMIYIDQPEKSVEALAAEGLPHEFVELAERFPDHFGEYFPNGVTVASFAEALELGRRIYVAEGCWHCHSQQIRPVSKENLRWGPVSHAREYQNALQRPVLFGTRRVGPDLFREGARRSNDWHLAHFYKPTSVSPTSVMPEYKWFFDDDGYPNKSGMAIIAYIQWMGSWLVEYPYFQGEGPSGPTVEDNVPDDTRAAGFGPLLYPPIGLPMNGKALRHRFLLAPSGQMKIAQRFNAGIGTGPKAHSPVGTTEQTSVVPTGLKERSGAAFPVLKHWAIVTRPYGTIPGQDEGKAKGLSPRGLTDEQGTALQ